MTLRVRLQLLIVAVAALPLLLTAWLALRVHQRALDRQVDETQRVEARAAARLAQARIDGLVRTFQLLGTQVEWPRLTAAERQGALWLAYGQADDATAVMLFDETGQALGDPIRSVGEPQPSNPASRPPVPLPALSALASAMPATQAMSAASRHALGEPIATGPGLPALLPLALSVAGRGSGGQWTLGLGLSLGRLCAELGRIGGGAELLLVDGGGRSLCAQGGREALVALDSSLAAVPRTDGTSATYRDGAGVDYRVAVAALERPGWSVISRRRSALALAAGQRIRIQTVITLLSSLLLALVGGWLMVRRIPTRVDRIVRGTVAIAEGQLDHRFDEQGEDELAGIAVAFNHMSREVEKRDDEIRSWNEELQQRVNQRTRELREAHEQILRSDKLAAVNSLGAGLSDHIQPALTSITNHVRSLLRRRERGETFNDVPTLVAIDDATRRIALVVQGLGMLSNRFADADHLPLGIPALLEEALVPLEPRLAMAGIRPARFYEDLAPRVLGSGDELRRAFREIFRNSLAAMPEGGTLTLSVRSLEGRALVVTITDSGRGMTQDEKEHVFDAFFQGQGEAIDDASAGLGLTIVHDVVARHHGRIDLESAVGTGTTVRITLPALVEERNAA